MQQMMGYPRGSVMARIFEIQHRGMPYRGLRPATQWIFVEPTRRVGGYLGFENGWGEGDPDSPVQFCMDESGRIRLRGRISGGTVGTVAFTLPEGFHPPQPQTYVLANGTTGYANCEIGTDGTVTIVGIV